MRRLATAALLLTSATTLAAQAPGVGKRYAPSVAPSAAHVEAMRALDFLVGDWEGTGWIQMGRERRLTFSQRETVRRAAGATALVIDGEGTGTSAGSDSGLVIHDAFAIVTYDGEAKRYRIRALRAATGTAADDTPQVDEGKLVWGLAVPGGGRMRFTIVRTPAGEWLETGEYSPDGARWFKSTEMTLRKIDR